MIKLQTNEFYDAIVVGGGPAGAAFATFLQRQGHRCMIMDHSVFPRYHIGESLIPQTNEILDRLGLLGKLKQSAFTVKRSVRFVSCSGKESQPFYFSETIKGEKSETWQVPRAEFDQMCLENAIQSGVDVRMQTNVKEVLFEDGRAVGVRARWPGGEICDLSSKFVADASGRSTLIGSQLGLKSEATGLNKASIWAYFRGGKRLEGIDEGETTVFMIPEGGWFWYIPLPNDIVSVGLVADPDYLFAGDSNPSKAFLHEMEGCQPLMARLVRAERISRVRNLRRLAYVNRCIVGDGWLMIGDAAAFLDPIYSSGLFFALASAELAADSAHRALGAGDVSAESLGGHVETLSRGVEVFRRLIMAFYDEAFSFGKFVDRFPDQRSSLIDCLIGDVINKDMDSFLEALGKMTTTQAA